MKKKKRGIKTQLVTLSLIMTVFLSSFSVHALEFAPHNYTFTHGNMQLQAYVASATALYEASAGVISTDVAEVDICNVMNITLDDYYTGTITIKFTYSSSNWQQDLGKWNIIVEGGTIDALVYSNGSFRIKVYDKDSVQIILHTSLSMLASNIGNNLDPYFKVTSVSSSLTAETNHNNYYSNVKSIDTRLTTANTNLSTIIDKLEAANAIYSDILTNTDDIEGYVQNIYNQNNDGNISTDIENLLDDLGDTADTISSRINTSNTRLNNIYFAISAFQQVLGVYDADNPQDTILDCVNNIASNQDDILLDLTNIYTTLSSMAQNQSTIITKLNSMGADLSSMASTIISINTASNNIYSTLLSLKTLLETQNNLISNIDNLIDTITWNNYSNFSYLGNSLTVDGTYEIPSATITYPSNSEIFMKFQVYSSENSAIHCIKLPVRFSTTISRYKPIVQFKFYSTSNREIDVRNVYYYVSGDSIFVFFNLINSSVSNLIVSAYTETSNYRLYSNANPTVAYKYISNTDIEYWKLSSYFIQLQSVEHDINFDQDLYQILEDIITAIYNINVTVNVTEQEITNITNNFDTDINTIHNVENNFKIDFDGWNNQLPSSDLSVDLSPYNSTVNFLKTNITNLWSNPFVNLPIIVSCLCFVFMVILG